MALSSNNRNDNIEMEPLTTKQIPGALCTTPRPKRANAKKLQFSTPEFSVTPISTISANPRLMPSRRREEAMVMANLRKRVAACDLTRTRPTPEDPNANEAEQEQLDNRPLLPTVNSKRDLKDGEESPKPILQDKDFILDCLCWHNEYRARHSAPALTISPGLCDHAQQWANHLASTNEFYYRSQKNLGQNLFCCPISALVTDLTGQEVASYWYSTVRRYNYFKDINLLHTNVNAGHFTQMVWIGSKYFGVGKATSSTGKIFVVAYYYPAGNVVNTFHENVLFPILDDQDHPKSPKDSDNNPITPILKDSDFDMKLLKTKLRIRVKKAEYLKKVLIPRDSVKNIEIDFYNFDEHLAAFITSFPNLKSIILLALDNYFFTDEFVAMAAGLPALSKMDIRIWNKLDRFDYNEYDIEESTLDTVYRLMNQCSKLKLVKVLSKFDFRFHDLDSYDSVGIDQAKKTLQDFGNKLNTEKPRWKFVYDIPLVDHNGTGYSYSMKK